MKLPRDVSGDELAKRLEKFGYISLIKIVKKYSQGGLAKVS